MKILTLIGCLSFVFVADLRSAINEQNHSGTIYGYVFNASSENTSSHVAKTYKRNDRIAGQEVVLHSSVDGQAVEDARPHTITDAKGHFEFTGLEVGERFAYYPATVFDDIEYYGEIVTIKPDSIRKRSDVLAFETTPSDSNIAIGTHHIIIKPGIGVLNIREYYFFANRGRRTYVGNAPAGPPNKNIVLRINLPEKAIDMQFGGDLMTCCAVVNENHIFDTMEFKPGTRQIIVNYLLRYKGKAASLIKEITHNTAELDIFLPKGTGTLTASNFTAQPTFEIRGQNYQRYQGANWTKGSMLSLAIKDLPATAPDLRWLAPVVLVVLFLAVYGVFRRRKLNQSMTKSSKEALEEGQNAKDRHRLLEQILQLDDAFEAGAINETTYYTVREKLWQLVFQLEAKHENFHFDELKKKGE